MTNNTASWQTYTIVISATDGTGRVVNSSPVTLAPYSGTGGTVNEPFPFTWSLQATPLLGNGDQTPVQVSSGSGSQTGGLSGSGPGQSPPGVGTSPPSNPGNTGATNPPTQGSDGSDAEAIIADADENAADIVDAIMGLPHNTNAAVNVNVSITNIVSASTNSGGAVSNIWNQLGDTLNTNSLPVLSSLSPFDEESQSGAVASAEGASSNLIAFAAGFATNQAATVSNEMAAPDTNWALAFDPSLGVHPEQTLSIDLNPLHYDVINALAALVKSLLGWLETFLTLIWCVQVAQRYVTGVYSVTKPEVSKIEIAGEDFWTALLNVLAAGSLGVIIVGGVAAILQRLYGFQSAFNLNPWAVLDGSAPIGGNALGTPHGGDSFGPIRWALYIANAFIPIPYTIYCAGFCVVFITLLASYQVYASAYTRGYQVSGTFIARVIGMVRILFGG